MDGHYQTHRLPTTQSTMKWAINFYPESADCIKKKKKKKKNTTKSCQTHKENYNFPFKKSFNNRLLTLL